MTALTPALNTAPRYTHDCTLCHFVGQMDDADLYFCNKMNPTVIARYSSDGPEYSSGLFSAYGSSPHLTAAREAAQAAGLMEFDLKDALNYTPRKAAPVRLAELKQHLSASTLGKALALLTTDVEKGTAALQTWITADAAAYQKRFSHDVEADKFLEWATSTAWKAYEWMAPLGLPAASHATFAKALYSQT